MDGKGKTYIDPIRDSQKESITPALPGEKSRAKDAALSLRAAEDSASSATMGTDDSVSGARSGEENVTNLFTGTGKNAKGKYDGKIGKKLSPIITIIILICGGGGLFFGASALLPFHIVEMFETVYGSSFVARQARAPYLLKWVFGLENDEVRMTATKRTILGEKYQKFTSKITNKTDQLAENGITVFKKGTSIADLPDNIDFPEGTKVRLSTGEEVDIGGLSNKQSLITNFGSSAADAELSFKDDVLIFDNNGTKTLVSANTYGDQYRSNTELRNSVNNSMKTWLGRVADWIDATAAKFFLRHNLTKNLFGNWSEQKLKEQGVEIEDVIAERSKTDFGSKTEYDIEVRDEKTGEVSLEHESPNGSTGNVRSKADIASALTNVGQAATNVVCGAAAVSAAATAIKVATAISNAEQYFTAYASAVDQTKAGDNGPVSDLTNALLEKDSDNKTALDDQGMSYVLSQGTTSVNKNDSVTSSMNIESVFKSAGTTTSTVVACALSKAGLAVVSGVLSVVTLGTFSIGKAAIGAAISVVLGVTISKIIENALANVTSNFCTDESGVKKGACMAFGGANVFNGNSQSGGGTAASYEEVASFYDTQVAVLEWEAEYERSTLSPFDITSSNTFLGSIVSNTIVPLATAMRSGITSTISSVASTTNSSMIALLPTASAIEKTTYLDNAIGDCPNLESIGAVGDIYCNPIIISDTSTNAEDPESLVITVSQLGDNFKMKTDSAGNKTEQIELNSNGIETIEPNSNLGKYILYCSQRSSQLGAIDYNILNANAKGFSGGSTLATVGNSLLGSLPLVGDFIDIWDSIEQGNNISWANGANCVARSDNNTSISVSGSSMTYTDENGNSKTDTVAGATYSTLSWENELKYYRQYVEDDRIMQTSRDDYESPVVAFLDAYYEENPLDNSYEGILARYSGYTKEQVIAILEEMEYEEYVASYDPSTRYNFVTESSYDSASEKIATLSPSKIAFDIQNDDVLDSSINQNNIYARLTTWQSEKRRSFDFVLV